MRSKLFVLVAALSLLAALFVGIIGGAPTQVSAAPFAAPTPQTYNPANTDANVVTFANAKSITADTRWCADLRNYNGLDLQYVIDQGTVNTVTLKLQFSDDNVNFVDSAQTVVAANAADANSLQRYLVFGRYSCIYADVTNSNALVITAIGVAK